MKNNEMLKDYMTDRVEMLAWLKYSEAPAEIMAIWEKLDNLLFDEAYEVYKKDRGF